MTKPPKRPRDPNQLAKMMIDIATGEEPEKDPPSRKVGASGGTARAETLPPTRRSEIAKKAATARWKKAQTDA